jgi:arylsulfatase A-like enzyme
MNDTRIRFWNQCLVVIALLLVGGCSDHAVQQPNVILVMTDDQGYGDLSAHGNPVLETPHLDQLHSESIRFTDFHAAPMCTPTRGQLMTGVDAIRNGAMNVSSGRTLLRREFPTMPEVFREGGYQTGIFGKWHLGDNYPYRPQDRGFDESLWFPSSHISSLPDYWENDYFDDTYIRNGHRQAYTGYTSDVFFSEAIEWMRRVAESDQRFFCYIPTAAPHGPLFVPDKYRGPIAARLAEVETSLPGWNPDRGPALVSFLAMIANIDENMGRLEAFLSEAGLRDNTILIFLTDNGSTLGPHYYNAGMRGGKVTLWEGGHRVPCFVRWPEGGLREPGDMGGLAQVQDLLPTLIELCSLRSPKTHSDGANLAGVLRGETVPPEDRMLVINYSRMPIRQPATVMREGAAVLWKRWRLLEDRELYNLDADPRQATNVISEHPEVVSRMRAHLDQWWAGVEDRANTFEYVTIGSDKENPAMLSACEWADVFVDQQGQVRLGVPKNGFWHLEVASEGNYHFELRRWPREAGLPFQGSVPETRVTDGVLRAGKALPISRARIQIGEFSDEAIVSENDQAVHFSTKLTQGKTRLQTWFLDSSGQELCGAYYVYIRKE